MSLLGPEPEWCPKCEYAIREDGCYCNQLAEEGRLRDIAYADMLGGVRAFKQYTRESFERTDNNSAALDAAIDFNPGRDNLFFYGPTGCGKSHLSAIAARKYLPTRLVKTVHMDEVFLEIRRNIQNARVQEDWLRNLNTLRVVNIEDLAAEKATEFTVNFIYQMMDGRYRAQKNGLIISSNSSLDELAECWSPFDKPGRIRSRMEAMFKVFCLVGDKDRRYAR